jgi:hypothetical protein
VRTPSTGPVPSPTLAHTPPIANPSASPTPAVVGVLEPPTDRSAGLPAALAALAIVGSGAGLLRVLLAEPVDGAPAVGGTA